MAASSLCPGTYPATRVLRATTDVYTPDGVLIPAAHAELVDFGSREPN